MPANIHFFIHPGDNEEVGEDRRFQTEQRELSLVRCTREVGNQRFGRPGEDRAVGSTDGPTDRPQRSRSLRCGWRAQMLHLERVRGMLQAYRRAHDSSHDQGKLEQGEPGFVLHRRGRQTLQQKRHGERPRSPAWNAHPEMVSRKYESFFLFAAAEELLPRLYRDSIVPPPLSQTWSTLRNQDSPPLKLTVCKTPYQQRKPNTANSSFRRKAKSAPANVRELSAGRKFDSGSCRELPSLPSITFCDLLSWQDGGRRSGVERHGSWEIRAA